MKGKLLFGLVFLILLSSFVSSVDLDDAYMYYSMDDSNLTLNLPNDLSGNGRNALWNTGSNGQTGILAEAVEMDSGSSEYLRSDNVNEGTTRTVSFWVKTSTFSGTETVIGKRASTGARSIQWARVSADTWNFIWYNGGNTASGTINGVTVPNGTWEHVLVTQNGNNVEVFVNGVSAGTDSTSGKADINDEYSLGRIGSTENVQYYNGLFDEFGLYDRVLNSSEISALYNGGVGFNPYAPIPLLTANFTVTVENENSFNLTLNGTEYATTSGVISTGIFNNDTSLWDFNITSEGYFPQSYSNYNVSTNLTINLTKITYFTVNVENENNFNLTMNGTEYTTTTGNITTNIMNADSSKYDYTIYADGYVTNYYYNRAVSSNLTLNLSTAFSVNVTNLDNFSVMFEETDYFTRYGSVVENIHFSEYPANVSFDYVLGGTVTKAIPKACYGYENLTFGLFGGVHFSCFTPSGSLITYIQTGISQAIENTRVQFPYEQSYSVSSGTLHSNFPNDFGLMNLTVFSDGYVNRSFTNYNLSTNLSTTLFDNSITNNISFQEILSGDPLSNANVSVYYPNYDVVEFTTDANGTIFVPAVQNNTIQDGEYTFNVNSFGGYVTPVNFTDNFTEAQMPFSYVYNLTKINLTVNLFYRADGSVFNKTTNIYLQGVGNITTNNGTYSFDVLNLASGDYIVQAFSSGYFTEQRTINFFNQESISVNLYLLEDDLNTSNTLKVNVLDNTQSKVDGASVNLLEYDTSTLSYKSISECYTDAEGVCNFLIELNDKTYKYTATKTIGGSLLTASSGDEGVIFREDVAGGTAITFEQLEVTLVLQQTETYTFLESHYLRYNISENFNTTTNQSSVIVDFQTTDGSDTTVCIEFTNSNTGASELQVCVTGSSGTVTPTTPFTLNRSITHKLEVYQIASDGSKTNLDTFYYNSDTSLQENLKNYAILSPFILALWVVIIAVALYSGVLPILVVLGTILSVAELALFPNYMIASGMVLKIIILLQIFYFGRKKEDFN